MRIMNSATTKPQKGDRVWIVPIARPGNSRWGTVEKVGNKYFYLKELPDLKFAIEDWRHVTEFSVRYKLYPSQEECDRSRQRQKTWSAIERFVRKYYTVPDRLSNEDLQKIAELLGVKPDE